MELRKLMLLLILVPALALVGCFGDDDDPADPDEDTTPPAAVGDLIAYDATLNTITLSWTAPGDDGNTGTASSYDIRYTMRNNRLDWASATQLSGEPSPGAPGSQEVWVVQGLDEATEYSFALKTADEVPNWSDMSNTAVDTTLGSLMVTGGQAGWYSLIDVNTGEELAHVQASGLQLRGEPSLGFQSRTLFILSPTGPGGANTAIYSCDPFTGPPFTQITDDEDLDVRTLDGNPVAPVIAFSASDTGNWDENIYTIAEGGGTPTQLTFRQQQFALNRVQVEILDAYHPVWSPDGQKIAFFCAVNEVGIGGNRFDVVCVMDADGGNLTPIYSQALETAHYDTPCWTADGAYVAFMEGNPNNEGVMFVSMATGTAYNLWDALDVAAYAPDMLTMDPWHMAVAVYYNYPSGSDVWVAELSTAGDVISAGAPVMLTDQSSYGHAYGWPDWAPWSPLFD